MFFYNNQLELDETSQLPLSHVSTIRFDPNDGARAWLGCSDGAIYRFEMESLRADRHLAHEQCVADLAVTDNYLLCLSKNRVKLFDIQQSGSGNSRCDLARSASKKRCLNGELKSAGSESKVVGSSHLVKLGSRSALSCLCALDEDQFLFGGAQSELLLFDAKQLKVINKFPLHLLDSTSASSCIKMKRIGSRNLVATSTLGGRMFIHDRNSLKPIMTFKSFAFSNTDFDVIDGNYILSTGSNSGYSSTEKAINVFDLRINRELVWHDDSRFYRPSFVRGLPNGKEHNLLTLDRNGIGELMRIENENSFTCSGKRFAIPLQPNASICAYDVDASVLLTADRNGYLHRSRLNATEKRPAYRLSNCPIVESHELTTQHIRIDDIVVRPDDDQTAEASLQSDESSGYPIDEIKRSYKIKTHAFLNHRSLSFGFSYYQDRLNDITQCFNCDS